MSSLWPRVSLLIGSVAFYIDASNSGLLSCTDSIALVIACWCRWDFNDSHGRPHKKKTQPRNRSEHTFSSHRVFIQTSSLTSNLCRSVFIVSSVVTGGLWSVFPPQKKHTRSKKRGSYFPRTILQNVALWLLRRALRKEKQASSYGGLLQMKGFAKSDSVCQSPAGLFSLWNAIAPRDTPLSLHHLGTSREQRAASAEQTARRPRRLTTILPTALSAGCHDSMGGGGGLP